MVVSFVFRRRVWRGTCEWYERRIRSKRTRASIPQPNGEGGPIPLDRYCLAGNRCASLSNVP
jgi:hypothetical protein